MMARPKGKPRAMKDIRRAVNMYIDGVKMDDIAAQFGVTQPTVTYWMKRHGESLGRAKFIQSKRKQGRRADTTPGERDADICLKVKLGVPAAQMGTQHGITRARASYIVKTWDKRGYAPVNPYKAGQVIKYGTRPERYVIVELIGFKRFKGLQVVDVDGNRPSPAKETNLPWYFQGELAEVASDTAAS